MKGFEIHVEFSRPRTQVIPVLVAREHASGMGRMEAGKPLGRALAVRPGQNQAVAGLKAKAKSNKQLGATNERLVQPRSSVKRSVRKHYEN